MPSAMHGVAGPTGENGTKELPVASHSRYEIVNTIAAGDFATVYRARDRALGREVAIKQIHPQFLSDQRQLTRYWQEAQLLATLQHPNILTIYDIDRPLGWLILELMQGSVKQLANDQPLDLDFLRVVLTCSLSALHFLHNNGVIHGDLKPSNLLVDGQYRVKLGDFGLARRALSDEGSLLKGTTKYMAPELVAPQFGPVGPASDLYSLGFAAYELMCGTQFESLFPGLAGFGRDRQIAWMMWHAAPDRNLPEIGRALQGVPQDLAHVIQRMVVKDQSRRYHSAAEALADLRSKSTMAAPAPPAAVDNAPRIRRRRLIWAAVVLSLSLMGVVAWLLMPHNGRSGQAANAEPIYGMVTEVSPDEQKFVVESSEDGKRVPVTLKFKDRIFINHKETRVFRDLHKGDRVAVSRLRDDVRGTITEVQASRPQTRRGRVTGVKPDEGQFRLSVTEGDDQGKLRWIAVPGTVKIHFNGRSEFSERQPAGPNSEEKVVTRPVRLSDLQLDDRVTVADYESETGLLATEMAVERVMPLKGVVRSVEPKQHQITFALGDEENAPLVTLPYAANCLVTINERKIMDGKSLEPVDLKAGDKAYRVAHDSQVLEVNVTRILGKAGLVQNIDASARKIEVLTEGASKPSAYQADTNCRITLSGEPAALEDLRNADIVDVTLDQPNAPIPVAREISARRPVDANRWAILIGVDQYNDPSLTPLTTPGADAKLLFDALTRRYGVAPEQALLLNNEQTLLVRLQQAIPNLLGRVAPESEVLIYFAGHAYRDADGKVQLAPKDFQLSRASETGLALQWLADQFEQCPAKAKLLLLDACQPGDGKDLKAEPSAAEMLGTVKGPPGYAPFRTVTALGSCLAGQRGTILPEGSDGKRHGLFATCLADGYAGKADANRDNRVEFSELFSYLEQAMAQAGARAKARQTAKLFLPDARPPRLSEEAKTAIRKLVLLFHQDRLDMARIQAEYEETVKVTNDQPEPKLLQALLFLKVRKREKARREFEELSAALPKHLLPSQALAWIQFEALGYQAGIDELTSLVSKVPPLKAPTDPLGEPLTRLFTWIGRLREFVGAAADARRVNQASLTGLDNVVDGFGLEAARAYADGRAKTHAIVQEFDRKIADPQGEAGDAKARIERHQLNKYTTFPFDEAVQSILAGTEQ